MPSTSSFALQRARRALAGRPATSARGRGSRRRRPGRAAPGRVMPPQFHQPSGRRGSLRLSTTTSSRLRAPGTRPLASTMNGRIRVDAEADALPVEEHGRAAPGLLERERPAVALDLRRDEAEPVLLDRAWVQLGPRVGVEDARHERRVPWAGLRRAAADQLRARARSPPSRRPPAVGAAAAEPVRRPGRASPSRCRA